MVKIFWFWLLTLILSSTHVTASANGLPDTIDRVRDSVVAVGTAYPPNQPSPNRGHVAFHGTGFVVGDGLHVITAYHTVPKELDEENKQRLAVFTGRGAETRARSAEVLRVDEMRDIALLKISGAALPALKLVAEAEVREGEAIAFTGFPLGMVLGLQPVTHRGIVSSIAPMLPPQPDSGSLTPDRVKALRNPFDALQLDAVSYPGNSGSPVYRQNGGEVVGLLSSTLVQKPSKSVVERPSGISFAIPVHFLHQLLAGSNAGQ